jgi:hypothetical protein
MSIFNPIETKSIEELVEEAILFINSQEEMSAEEEIEDDAEYGYFQDEDD